MYEYRLIDSGNQRKLEDFGGILLNRPCASAIWQPQHPAEWQRTHATFLREESNQWEGKIPPEWRASLEGFSFLLKATGFGHVGLFPEHAQQWKWIQECIGSGCHKVLNLFAYSGGATLAAAAAGAEVCHLDASQGMVDWARANAKENKLENAPIRWITDDARKFLQRENRRGREYDLIILDPPSFGRGKKGEIFKIEEHLPELLQLCKSLLSSKGAILLSCHTPGYTPIVLQQLLKQNFGEGALSSGEMLLSGDANTFSVALGSYATWRKQ